MRLKDHIENKAFSTQQIHQLKLAERDGLDIDKLANPDFTWRQMEELRNALQLGLDIEMIAYPGIPADQMKRWREEEADKLYIYDQAKEEYRRYRMRNISIFLFIVFVITVVFYLGYSNKDFLMSYMEAPDLELVTNYVTHNLSEDEIDLMSFIKEYDDRYKIEISQKDVTLPGNYEILYSQSNGIKSTERYLMLKVVDDVPPILTLSQASIEIEQGSEFDPFSYIDKCYDEVDGDLLNFLQISPFDESLKQQKINYRVEDKSGNTAEKQLEIKTYSKPVVIPEKPSGNSQNQSGNNNSSTSSSEEPVQKLEPITKYFLFSDGYDMNTSFDSCVQEGSKYTHYACYPIKDENGIYKGYRLEAR